MKYLSVSGRERALCNFAVFPQLGAAVDVTERPAACAQIAAAMTFGYGCFPLTPGIRLIDSGRSYLN